MDYLQIIRLVMIITAAPMGVFDLFFLERKRIGKVGFSKKQSPPKNNRSFKI